MTEALARRAAGDEIDFAICSEKCSNLFSVEIDYGSAFGAAVRKVAPMSRNVIAVAINGEDNVESGLFESE
jgi:hypothetical protein